MNVSDIFLFCFEETSVSSPSILCLYCLRRSAPSPFYSYLPQVSDTPILSPLEDRVHNFPIPQPIPTPSESCLSVSRLLTLITYLSVHIYIYIIQIKNCLLLVTIRIE